MCQVASAGKDRCVKLWDVRVDGSKRECMRLIDSHAQIPLALAWAPSSSTSFSSSSSPSPAPPPGLEGSSSAMHIANNESENEDEKTKVLLSVAFDDGSVALLDLRMLPQQRRGNRKGGGGGGGGISSSSGIRAHKTRANVLAFSPSSSSFPSFLASGGDDGQVVVTPIVCEKDGEGGRRTIASTRGGREGRSAAAACMHSDYVRGLGWLATGGREGRGAAAASSSSLSSLLRPGVLLSGGWDGQLKGWAWREEGGREEQEGEQTNY